MAEIGSLGRKSLHKREMLHKQARNYLLILKSAETIVSQPSKCLKFMTFREGCFVIRNWMQVLKWSSWDFLSPLVVQKMKEDNISQLGDYDVLFCEQQYTRESCCISLFKFKSFDQTASNFRHLLSCGTIVTLIQGRLGMKAFFYISCRDATMIVQFLTGSPTGKTKKFH